MTGGSKSGFVGIGKDKDINGSIPMHVDYSDSDIEGENGAE